VAYQQRVISAWTVSVGVVPTLGRTCDDLVVCAPDVARQNRPNRMASRICSMPPVWDAERPRWGRKLQRLTFRYKHGLRQERICICHDDVEYRLRLRKADPLMNVENQNKWMTLRRPSSARWCVSLALLSATVLPAPSFAQGTRTQRIACTPDALRLCSAFIPNADEITTCLKEKNAELSDACRMAFEATMNQLPDVSDGTGAPKRTAR
jgi:hypothetical protein